MKRGLSLAAVAVLVLMLILPNAALAQAAPPTAPSGLAATVVSTTQVSLTWTDNSNNETGFRVERSTDGTTFTALATVGAGVTASNDATVTAGSTFFYRVVATSAAGDSTASNVVRAQVAAPAAPSDLSAIIMSATRVDLIWMDQSHNETTFRIERSLDNFATAPSATFTAARDLRTFSDTTVAQTNTYSYRAVAVNGVGSSAPSNTATVKVTGALQVGPIDPAFIFNGDPNTSFPGYYQDDQGTRVALLPPTGNGLTPPTQLFDPPDPSNPYQVFLGIGEEAFYYIAESSFNTVSGIAKSRFAVEANVFGPGTEVVFTRIRLFAKVPAPGTYIFQHPYGTDTLEVTQEDVDVNRGIRFTEDVGLADRNFTLATTGRINRFLHQTVPPPPAGWIGDGISLGPVTGSPLTPAFNKVRLTAPVGVNLDGAGHNFIESDQFTVSGRLQTAVTPIPSFNKALSPTTGIAPNTVTFTDTSTGTPTSWAWDFGDGTTSALRNPTKTYNTAGNYTVRLTVTNAAGRVSTSQTVTIFSGPVASFTKTVPNGVPPVTISFRDTSTGNPTSWSWDFGDSATSTLQNPNHTYAAAGTYTITLTATNAAGSASTSQTLSISPNLVASFTKSAASGVAPLAVNFTDTSTGTITSRLWEFGDGTTSTVQNPAKTYNTAGNYTVTLTITDAAGTAATSQVVSVFSTPVASFTKSTARGVPPLTVAFSDTSTGNVTGWTWAFGDGTTSNLQNPSKVYSAAGSYTITLTVTNTAGTSSTSQTLIVTSLPPSVPLVLQVGPIDSRFIFNGDPNTSFPAYYEDDQGTRVSLLPITGNGATAPTQVFEPVDTTNPYSVFLGMGGEAFYHIATVDFATRLGRAGARFALEANVATPGSEVVFTRVRLKALVPTPGTYTFQHPYGTETLEVTQDDIDARGGIFFTRDIGLAARDFFVAAGGDIPRFLRQTVPPSPLGWIGDGVSVGPVTGSPLTPAFNKVRLTGPVGVDLDGAGHNFVESNQFTVSGRLFTSLIPSIAKTLNPVNGVAPVTVTFTGSVTGGVATSWLWNFGDGTTSTLQNPPAKTYTTPGNYTVTLTVANATEATTMSQVVSVFGTLAASFTKSAASGVAPLTIIFTDTSTGNPASWLWNFGDGTTSTLQNPTKTYTTAGNFTVTLTVTNPVGPASTSQAVSVTAFIAAPTALSAFAGNATQVNLTWTDSSNNETSFIVERSTDGINFAQVGTVNSTTTNTTGTQVAFSDNGVVGGTAYTYRVKASNAFGISAPSAVATITTPNVQLTGLTSPTGLTVNANGVAQANATVTTNDGKAKLNVNQGTRLQTKTGQAITALSAAPVTAAPPQAPPQNTVVLAVDFGPNGATFNPPLTVVMSYNPATLPANVRENKLSVAFWDGANWLKLNTIVDTTAKTLTALLPHFTVVGILGEEEPPAQQVVVPQPAATPAPVPTATPMPPPIIIPEDKVVPITKKEGETTTIVQPTKEVKVELEDKTTITVPPLALPATTQMKAHKVEEKDLPKPITKGKVRKAIEIEVFDDKGAKMASPEIRLPIVIEVPLTADDLAAIGNDPNNVELHRYDDGTQTWVKLASELDLTKKVVRAQLRHLSLFAVVVPAPVAQAQPTPTAAPPSAGGEVPGSPAWLAAIVVGLGILLFGFRLLRGARQPNKKE